MQRRLRWMPAAAQPQNGGYIMLRWHACVLPEDWQKSRSYCDLRMLTC